ncbi:hypothetical protein B005_3068 [Nocardiopsis alba ATCC BAA-2165]|uniref:Uncharacterized protein n=1 Tax=Nocardiopsis alba (strain ATCC BAA-2165 / BE74) TaxID=1205910 RepID=J7L691_NOCAA|nr:hypothetical protein B005_3068 [Nocardiopsis alba ATCC BAA-2165]
MLLRWTGEEHGPGGDGRSFPRGLERRRRRGDLARPRLGGASQLRDSAGLAAGCGRVPDFARSTPVVPFGAAQPLYCTRRSFAANMAITPALTCVSFDLGRGFQ